jgi:L-lactate dehydrogenase complex protein LldF
VLIYLRGRVVQEKQEHVLGRFGPESVAMQVMARTFADPRQYEEAQRLARLGQWPFVHGGTITDLPGPLGGWTTMRDLQAVPKQSFREWWRSRAAPAQTSQELLTEHVSEMSQGSSAASRNTEEAS